MGTTKRISLKTDNRDGIYFGHCDDYCEFNCLGKMAKKSRTKGVMRRKAGDIIPLDGTT